MSVVTLSIMALIIWLQYLQAAFCLSFSKISTSCHSAAFFLPLSAGILTFLLWFSAVSTVASHTKDIKGDTGE